MYQVYEITAAGFFGGTDATDDRVLFVAARSARQIMKIAKGLGATFCGEVEAYDARDVFCDLTAEGGEEILRYQLQSFMHNPPVSQSGDDALLSPEQLAARYNPEGDGGEHPIFMRANWQDAVAQDDTLQGYWSWVHHMLTTEHDHHMHASQGG